MRWFYGMHWFYWSIWKLVRTIGQLFFGLHTVDEEHVICEGPVIFAPNHQSYLDPPLVSVMIKREVSFFAKKELFDIPIMGRLIRQLNAFPVRRGIYDPTALNKVFDILNNGGGVIMFPEGTRGDGETFLKPKPGIGMVACRAGVPIVPIYSRYTHQWKKALFWRNRMTVTFGEPIPVSKVREFGNDKEGYRALSEYVMERVSELKASQCGTGEESGRT